MSTWQKKPVRVQAVPVSRALAMASHDWQGLPVWLRDAYEAGEVIFARDHVIIKTLEGSMTGDHQSWIIQGVQGEIYPCKDDIFRATYDPVAG